MSQSQPTAPGNAAWAKLKALWRRVSPWTKLSIHQKDAICILFVYGTSIRQCAKLAGVSSWIARRAIKERGPLTVKLVEGFGHFQGEISQFPQPAKTPVSPDAIQRLYPSARRK